MTHVHEWYGSPKRCRECNVLRSDCYRTPEEELARVFDVLGDVDLDPCADADPDNHVAVDNWDSGGNRPWHGRVFVNPPYSVLAMWVPLCTRPGPQAVLALIPPSTGTGYWHQHVFGQAREICFVKGRISFLDPDTGEPVTANRYESAYVLWTSDGKIIGRFRREYASVGRVVTL